MKNPNGYGGITKLSGNRRNPFRVRITTGWSYDETTGRQRQQYETLGYYPSRKEAMLALAAYNSNPYDLDAAKITFAEMYYKYIASEAVPESMKKVYKAAFNNLVPLHNMKMANIKKVHLQTALDDKAELSTVYLTKMRALIKNIYNYGIDNDIIIKNYAQNLKIGGQDKKESIHKPYTPEEIKLLWENLNIPVKLKLARKQYIEIYPADTILMLIYTGMRPGELLEIKTEAVNLDEKYIIGGFKTDAGKNRVIPIHDDILPLIKKRIEAGNEYLITYKMDIPPTMDQYAKYMFNPIIKGLGMDHLPHDGRHTFATFADKYITDKFITKRIMGHSIKDITQKVYTHKEVAELRSEVNKIKFTN